MGDVLVDPGGQLAHAVELVTLVNVPEGHDVHVDAAGTLLKRPAAH